ncbi:hypothetical protein PG994_013632 [Apiospora phragmitis]|uniref:Alpha/beta hydrolase fold-3 domain-containing protein n=1 Tax=Apiospora phragmitis TaxID=2905665 RepID=A0ABR1T982_9PEZI
MASPQQQPVRDLFHYLRLKIFVLVFRLLLRWRTAEHIRRDSAILPLSEAGVRKQRIEIPSSHGGRSIVADLYLPTPPYDSDNGDGKEDNDALGKGIKQKRHLPVLVNWHGSGFVFPLHGTDAYFCTRMARDAGVAVLDADYRKAPECPYPAAIDDAEDALRWVASSSASASYKLDPLRVAVSGFSAGGHIAAVAASHLRKKLEMDENQLKIQMLLSVYGSSDLATDGAAKTPPSPVAACAPAVDPEHVRRRLRARPAARAHRLGRVAVVCGPGRVPCDGGVLDKKTENDDDDGNDANGNVEKIQKKRDVHYKMLEGVCHAFDKGLKEDGNSGSLAWTRREEAYAWAASLLKVALHPKL